jgi:predicted phage tail protein
MTEAKYIAGSGGGGCFTGDTLVSTPNGQVRIDELKEGGKVISFDDKGNTHVAKVLKVHVHEDEQVYRYGFWGNEYVDATPNHWVLNQYNAFVAIGSLGFDDCLIDVMGHLRPMTSRQELGRFTVYNLTVEQQHTFIANNIRVHNAGLGARIAGAGGGGGKSGGGGSSPTEADDSLQSKQFANVLDLISEGEIQGLDDGNKSIFFDGTPLQAADGSYNFTDYSVATRTGTQTQNYIPGVFSNVESETSVGVEVTNAAPVTRQITDSDVDRVRVTIEIPSLRKVEDDGDIVGTNVSISIQVRYSGGSFQTVKTDKIKGKSSGRYQRDYLLTLSGAFPVDIKVVRNTADNGSSTLSNTTNWQSFTSIVDAKLAYPNSALVGLRFGSSQFNNIPQRKYLIRGIKVGVPTNAKIDTSATERLVVSTGSTETITGGIPGRITYTGVWNGQLSTDQGAPGGAVWTNDPAWCLWDLLTNDRYGVGVAESSLDRYDFFAVSQYCNTLVNDGNGGQEPRFSCNLLINQRKEVYNVIQEMSSIFRGISFYGAGSLVLLQDKPSDAQYTLGPANVIDGSFSYSGSSIRARHTCATVAYHSYDELGEVSFEYVEDADAVSKYGVNNKDIKAIGCYSQGQANRLGKWTLLSEQDLYETCNFAIGIDSGIIIRPGMVVDIADPLRGGTRRNGRVSSATTLQITIDSTTELSVNMGNGPTISVILPNGLIETRDIDSINGTAVSVSNAFSQAPAANAPWLIQTTDIESQQFRVVSVAENDDGTLGVSAIKYNETIYDAVEKDLNLTQRDITNISAAPEAVSNISVAEFLYEEGGTVRTGVDLSWSSPLTNVNDFVVRYRLDNNNFERIVTNTPSTQIKGLKAGSLEIQVTARSFIGKSGPITKQTFPVQGKTAIPGNVQNLTLEPLNYNSARLRWDETVDLDVKVSGKVHIRHSNLTDGSATWTNSTDLIAAVAGSATEATVPLLEGEYLVKFEDDGLRKSATETSIIVDQPVAQTFFGVKTQREDQITPTPFTGSKTDTTYDSTYDALILDSDGLTAGTGEYTFSSTLDLEAVYSLDLERRLVARGIYPSDTWDSRTALIDTWQDIDGGVVDQVNAELYVRKTNDDPSGTPTYSAWQPLANGVLKARAFQFKAVLTSSDAAQNILVDELGYKAQFSQRTEQSTSAIASGTSAKAVTFTNAFFTGTSSLGGANSALPTIGITPQNMATGDFFELSSISRTGFTVTFKNSSGTIVDRNFNYMATGFGKS